MKMVLSPASKKSKVVFIGKLIISFGLLGFLFWIVDWQKAVNIISHANKAWIAVGPGFLLLGILASALRWKLTLADSQVILPYKQAYIGYLTGIFYNSFLPGAIGGDVIRIGFCVRNTRCKPGIASASVILERIAGVIALVSYLFGIALFNPNTLSPLFSEELITLLEWAAIPWMGLIAAIFVGRQIWIKWRPKSQESGIKGFIYSGMQTLGNLQIRTLISLLILSAIFQGTNILGIFVLARAIGQDLPLSVFFGIIPIVYITTILPISLGGLGVRESSLVFLLAHFGVLKSEAITLSFLIYLNQVVVGMLGGLLQLNQSKLKPDTVADHKNINK